MGGGEYDIATDEDGGGGFCGLGGGAAPDFTGCGEGVDCCLLRGCGGWLRGILWLGIG
jgi:hypothetical protein